MRTARVQIAEIAAMRARGTTTCLRCPTRVIHPRVVQLMPHGAKQKGSKAVLRMPTIPSTNWVGNAYGVFVILTAYRQSQLNGEKEREKRERREGIFL